jgi:hypothetical protein
MAAFATSVACEDRVKAKMADKTWIVAHSCVTKTGVLAVRVQRYMTSALTQGAWAEITDDATT